MFNSLSLTFENVGLSVRTELSLWQVVKNAKGGGSWLHKEIIHSASFVLGRGFDTWKLSLALGRDFDMAAILETPFKVRHAYLQKEKKFPKRVRILQSPGNQGWESCLLLLGKCQKPLGLPASPPGA